MTATESHKPSRWSKAFDRFSTTASHAAGRPWAFAAACAVLIVWVITGPLFGFSDTWQLIINTGTTIVTFMMVFLIQHSENKNSRAVQMKLDELIAATKSASNRLIDIEELTDEELAKIHTRFERLADRASSTAARRDAPAEHGAATNGRGAAKSAHG
jgi:low affinity Fe/Cu permease